MTKFCPCSNAAGRRQKRLQEQTPSVFNFTNLFCIIRTPLSESLITLLESVNISYQSVRSDPGERLAKYLSRGCLNVINITNLADFPRQMSCPGICSPIPLLQFPKEWLSSRPNDTLGVTCSSTVATLRAEEKLLSQHPHRHQLKQHFDLFARRLAENNNNNNNNNNDNNINNNKINMTSDWQARHAVMLLQALAERRVQECREQSDWPIYLSARYNFTGYSNGSDSDSGDSSDSLGTYPQH